MFFKIPISLSFDIHCKEIEILKKFIKKIILFKIFLGIYEIMKKMSELIIRLVF